MYIPFNPECKESLERYLNEISEIPFISEDKERELAKEISYGSIEARNQLVKSHLKLVVSKAGSYSGKGVSLADLICEGNIGLFFAAEEFNPNKGKFSTYAEYWVKRAMSDALSSRTGVTHAEDSRDRFEVYKDNLKTRLNNRYRTNERTIEPFEWLGEVLSLDEPIGDDDSLSISDFLADTTNNPEDLVISDALNKGIKDDINKVMRDLNEKERAYITLYFGLDGNKAMTIEEISEAYKEPVRKVDRTIKSTLRNLRINEKVKVLKSYMTE